MALWVVLWPVFSSHFSSSCLVRLSGALSSYLSDLLSPPLQPSVSNTCRATPLAMVERRMNKTSFRCRQKAHWFDNGECFFLLIQGLRNPIPLILLASYPVAFLVQSGNGRGIHSLTQWVKFCGVHINHAYRSTSTNSWTLVSSTVSLSYSRVLSGYGSRCLLGNFRRLFCKWNFNLSA